MLAHLKMSLYMCRLIFFTIFTWQVAFWWYKNNAVTVVFIKTLRIMHSEFSKLIDSYNYSVLPNGKFPCINYMHRSVLSPKTVHYFKLHCRHHSHVMWTTSCKLWTPFWILLFDYKKCSWASGPGTTPHVHINYPGWSIHLSQWLGQDNPAASRVNLFTWNSSYQVWCAELTDALPHRWTTTPSSLMSGCFPNCIVLATTYSCSSSPLDASINKQNIPAIDACDVLIIKNSS